MPYNLVFFQMTIDDSYKDIIFPIYTDCYSTNTAESSREISQWKAKAQMISTLVEDGNLSYLLLSCHAMQQATLHMQYYLSIFTLSLTFVSKCLPIGETLPVFDSIRCKYTISGTLFCIHSMHSIFRCIYREIRF